jgi:hypothetical protein
MIPIDLFHVINLYLDLTNKIKLTSIDRRLYDFQHRYIKITNKDMLQLIKLNKVELDSYFLFNNRCKLLLTIYGKQQYTNFSYDSLLSCLSDPYFMKVYIPNFNPFCMKVRIPSFINPYVKYYNFLDDASMKDNVVHPEESCADVLCGLYLADELWNYNKLVLTINDVIYDLELIDFDCIYINTIHEYDNEHTIPELNKMKECKLTDPVKVINLMRAPFNVKYLKSAIKIDVGVKVNNRNVYLLYGKLSGKLRVKYYELSGLID